METVQRVAVVDVLRWTTVIDGKEHSFDYAYFPDGMDGIPSYRYGLTKYELWRDGYSVAGEGGLVLILSELNRFCDSCKIFCVSPKSVYDKCPICKSAEFLFCKYLLSTYAGAYISYLHDIDEVSSYESPDPWPIDYFPHVAEFIELEASNG